LTLIAESAKVRRPLELPSVPLNTFRRDLHNGQCPLSALDGDNFAGFCYIEGGGMKNLYQPGPYRTS